MPSTMLTTSTPPRAWPLLAAVTLVLACPSDDTVQNDGSGTSSTTAGSSSSAVTTTNGVTSTTGSTGASSATDPTAADSTGVPPLDACACTGPSEFIGCNGIADWVPGCPTTEPCPPVTAQCPRMPDLYTCRAELVFDEPALQCALEALRDGTPGRLEISGVDYWANFSPYSHHFVYMLEDRKAVSVGCLTDVAESAEFNASTLASPEYFTTCLEAPSPLDRYDCMIAGLSVGEDTPLPACVG